MRRLTGRQLTAVRFPVGGIGTGTISVAGNGDLTDFEIFNRPAKNRSLGFTFVTVWARKGAGPGVLRVARSEPPVAQEAAGPTRGGGFPHFRSATFEGGYPFGKVALHDEAFPVRVTLEAWNPFIPLSVDDSSLPVAILTYRVANPSNDSVEAVISLSAVNPVGHDYRSAADALATGFGNNQIVPATVPLPDRRMMHGLHMTSGKYKPVDVLHGSFAIAAICEAGDQVETATYAPATWDETTHGVALYGQHLRDTGHLFPGHEALPTPDGRTAWAALAPRVRLAPKEERTITFLIAWHFPNRENYWHKYPEIEGAVLRNDYGRRFGSAWQVIEHTGKSLPRLDSLTRAFHAALFSSTIPGCLVDAASSQMSIARSTTCFLLDDDTNGQALYGFEGSDNDAGSFPLNCTHVWNYAQTVAYLFPSLERGMRKVDFLSNLFPDDSMAFRTIVPLGRRRWDWYAAADGQLGTIMRLYREWQMSGDRAFLSEVWPHAKRALSYAWVYWDPNRDGVIVGEQHNTYDIEFCGANTMVGSLYLGALRAMAELARQLGDSSAAAEYQSLFKRGRVAHQRLWNGEYFIQEIPPASALKAPPTSGANENDPPLRGVKDGDIRFQVGNGCLSDQLVGQWLASQLGLGDLFDRDKVGSALRAIFKHNFRTTLREQVTTDRTFARFDDAGLLLCTWPRGHKPAWPAMYCDETWTGVEYQVAAHMLSEGLIPEALAIVKAARDRHDGERRNPWDDQEAGHHYARAMSSWSLILAASGFSYAAPQKQIGFAPRFRRHDFRCFFSTAFGWGTYAQTQSAGTFSATLNVVHGVLDLCTLDLQLVRSRGGPLRVSVVCGSPTGAAQKHEATVTTRGTQVRVSFTASIDLVAGSRLVVTLS